MSNVLTFHFDEHPVRIVELEDKKYFVIRDVCNILGWSNPNRELAKHTENKPLYERIRTPGGLQIVRLVPRADVEKLLAANHGRKAAELADWLQTEVYPSACFRISDWRRQKPCCKRTSRCCLPSWASPRSRHQRSIPIYHVAGR